VIWGFDPNEHEIFGLKVKILHCRAGGILVCNPTIYKKVAVVVGDLDYP
jgi:hypothetical protein